LIAKKWCDRHDSYPLALAFPQATKKASIEGIAKRCVRILRPAKDRPKFLLMKAALHQSKPGHSRFSTRATGG
jgi:hypothetical protein